MAQLKNILELKKITKKFPGVTALREVDFSCLPGEIHAIVGENGAGKSTLMKILSGVYHQTSGEVMFNGEEAHFATTEEAQRAGISIIFQEFSLIPEFTVAENIFLNREPVGRIGFLRKKEERRLAAQLIRDLGVSLDVDAKVEELSVVQQQVVEIVKALSVTAKVLIMDEPSATLTDVELKKLFEIIRNLKKKGVTIIYISHRLEELFEIADRVTVFKDGEVMGVRNVAEIEQDELISMMVGRKIVDIFPVSGSGGTEPILEVTGFTKGSILKNVGFTLYRGEILGIAGIVGAGRSLLAKCLFGIVKRDSGEVYRDGNMVEIRDVTDAIRCGIGYLPEDRKADGIMHFKNVLQNITIANLPKYETAGFLNYAEEVKDTRRFIEKLDIKAHGVAQNIETLSGGNQQKAIISRWLLKEPEVLIFDEPTRGIDIGAKYEIYKIIRSLADAGKGVIVISSELQEIIGLSDRILVMRSGEIGGVIDQRERRSTEEEVMSIAVGHTYTL